MRKSFFRIVALFLLATNLVACGSFGKKLRNYVKGNGWVEDTAPQKALSFNDTPNYRKGEQRKYVRMTKDQFEAEAKLGAQEGSLWVMEGQGSYLFSQNIVRLIGDLLTVKLEGAARTQVDTKIGVIKKLLKKIDGQGRRVAAEEQEVAAASADKKKDEKEKSKDGAKDSKAKDAKEGPVTAKNEGETSKDEESQLGVDAIPTRIIQRLQDGSYRVKGTQSFMIGKREFRVLVTGVIREQDFNDDGISSQALLEPVYDVVSVKKGI